MRLLIDGYNLLHATHLFGQGDQAGTLAGSREALVTFLIERLPRKLRAATTIVFDAAGAPPGLTPLTSREGLRIRFAQGWADADALLEHLIERHRSPKMLLVVSSDHRVQRAARSRGARYVDSQQWLRELRTARRTKGNELPDLSGPELAADFWVREFSQHVGPIDWPAENLPTEAEFPSPPVESPKPEAGKKECENGTVFPADYLKELEDEFGSDL
jgi:predicted RNA-binding protein with PIN domain